MANSLDAALAAYFEQSAFGAFLLGDQDKESLFRELAVRAKHGDLVADLERCHEYSRQICDECES